MTALAAHHHRIRRRGVNLPLYWLTRALLQPLLQAYFRLSRQGRHHVPGKGAVILAANHRSFLDPFVIGCCVRRPLYFMAKRELFEKRRNAWFLNALGAFPVKRGEADEEAIATARAVLARGDALVIFPEGTRIRQGPLAPPRRGLGRLALETGVPVVPVAVTGSERARRGPWVRPVRVRVRCGRPLTFPRVETPSQRLAAAVTARIWPCVELQWEWLGGLPPLRGAAVLGAGPMGRALAGRLAGAGVAVQLGCGSEARAAEVAGSIPAGVAPRPVADLELDRVDLLALAVPARALPAVCGELVARLPRGLAVLTLSKGVVGQGATPTRYVEEQVGARPVAWLGGPCHATEMATGGASVVLACTDADLSAQLAATLRRSGLEVERTADVVGAELAGCAKNAAALAAAAGAPAGMNTAGAAAARVFDEIHGLAVAHGASSRTFAGLAGVGDLVATALAAGSRNRRAGGLLAAGASRAEIAATLGGTAEALDSVPLLAAMIRREGAPAEAASELAALIEGRLSWERWAAAVGARSGADVRRAA